MDSANPPPIPRPPVEAFTLEVLRDQARWIRDRLEPIVARDGPNALCANDVLTLDDLIRKLFKRGLTVEELKSTRLPNAVRAIGGVASRWPARIIQRCEGLQGLWFMQMRSSSQLSARVMYERGGMLRSICRPSDREGLDLLLSGRMERAMVNLNSTAALKRGALEFMPGDWWINGVSAYRAGIINGSAISGGCVSDHIGTYAVVLAGDDEVAGSSPTPEKFQYRSKESDPGRYRLAAGGPGSRSAVRILRSCTLRSLWRPRAGIRYDGLHKIDGWSVKQLPDSKECEYIITFKRLVSESPGMDIVTCRPGQEEFEASLEYERLRLAQRLEQRNAAKMAVAL